MPKKTAQLALHHPKPPVGDTPTPVSKTQSVAECQEIMALDKKPPKIPTPQTEKAKSWFARLENSVRLDPERVMDNLFETRTEWASIDQTASVLASRIETLEKTLVDVSIKTVKKLPETPNMSVADRMRLKSIEREGEEKLVNCRTEIVNDLQTTENQLLDALGEWRDFRSLIAWLENIRVEQLAKLIDFVSDGKEVQRCVIELLRLVDRTKVVDIIARRAKYFKPLPLETWMVEQLVNYCQLQLEISDQQLARKQPASSVHHDDRLLDKEAPEIIRLWCARKCQPPVDQASNGRDPEFLLKKKASEISDRISRYFDERMRVDRLRLLHEADSHAHKASEDLLFCAKALAFLIGKNHADAVTRRNVLAQTTNA